MDEQFTLKEFLDPSLIKWMNFNLLLDCEHAATVASQKVGMSVKATSGIANRGRSLPEEKAVLSISNTLSSSEFKTSSNSEIQYLIDLNQNFNTKHSTSTWLRRFNQWALHKKLKIDDITDIPKAELDGVLQKFYAELVKQDGKEYETDFLKVMIASLSRHIKEACGYSILSDQDFELSRKVLNGKAIQLQQSGKGKRPRKADALTSDEEDLLWEKVLGKMNPVSLNYTIFS